MTIQIENLSRRNFIQGAAGLTLGVCLPLSVRAQAGPGKAGGVAVGSSTFEPNAFLRIGADNSITVISKHLEMGQGTYTGLATLVAEELDANWANVKVEGAPADAKRYNNLFWGPTQGTGGSTAMANSWEQLRKAGAAARSMLVASAAKKWNVPASEITVSEGIVSHAASKRKATFGELAQDAAAETVPAEVALKDPKDFKLIGKKAPRRDAVEKTNGKAVFTQDIHLPNMLVAMVAHPPRFGGKVKSFDAAETRKIKGVVDVIQIPNGVAVFAKDTWSAKKGRDALKVEWDDSAAFKLSSDQIFAKYRELAKTPGAVARKEGDTSKAFSSAAKVVEASYDFPYLAHAAMEPINCVIHLTADKCEVWNGEQFQTIDQMNLARTLASSLSRSHSICFMPVAALAAAQARIPTSCR